MLSPLFLPSKDWEKTGWVIDSVKGWEKQPWTRKQKTLILVLSVLQGFLCDIWISESWEHRTNSIAMSSPRRSGSHCLPYEHQEKAVLSEPSLKFSKFSIFLLQNQPKGPFIHFWETGPLQLQCFNDHPDCDCDSVAAFLERAHSWPPSPGP